MIDYQTLVEFIGYERLFRRADGSFLLHMSSERRETEDRIIWLAARDAISWLNETPDEFGSLWEFGEVARASECWLASSKALGSQTADISLALD